MNLYENIKARRLELGMSQQELSELTGYSGKSMISKIENGLVDIPVSKVSEFAKALQTTELQLVNWFDINTQLSTKDFDSLYNLIKRIDKNSIKEVF